MNANILELYSYTDEERETFRYLDKYMASIKMDYLTEYGFGLAGLFLTYRASNHSGTQMTSNSAVIAFPNDTLHYRSLVEFPNFFGVEIDSQSHYLRLVRLNMFRMMFFPPTINLQRIARLKLATPNF